MDKTPLLMPLTPAHLELPDDELGKLFLGLYVFAEAEKRGIHPDEVSEEFTRHVISLLPLIEATSAHLTTIEKVLRKAAAGEFTSAGQFLKEHMIDDVIHKAALDEAVTGSRRQRKNARKPRKRTSLAKTAIEYILTEPTAGSLAHQERGLGLERLRHYVGEGCRIKVDGRTIEITAIEDDDDKKTIGYVFEDRDLPASQDTKMTPISTIRGIVSRLRKQPPTK